MSFDTDYKTPATPPCEDGVATPLSIAELDEDDILDLDLSNPLALPTKSRTTKPPITPDVVDLSQENFDDQDVIMLSSDNEDVDSINFQPELSFTPAQIYPNKTHEEVIVTKRRLSGEQQVKFIQYCENTATQIQKDYIKWKNREAEAEAEGESFNKSQEENEYLIILLQNFKRLIDFIWLTIDWNCKDTANLLQEDSDYNNDYDGEKLKDVQDLGQVSILLKLSDDLLTLVCKFNIIDSINDQRVFRSIFKVFYILDYIFMLLAIDLKKNGSTALMKVTEAIRLKPILERSRIDLTNWFKECNINKYQYELSKIYERSLYNI